MPLDKGAMMPGRKHLIHLNGNCLCAVDTETTGLVPGLHEIWQICFLPLNASIEPSPDYPVFDILIQPEYPDRVENEAIKGKRDRFNEALKSGMPPHNAVDLFERWFESLRLAENKRISPLAQNWPYDFPFIQEWMGREHANFYIDSRYRDTFSTASYLNDRADFSGEEIPFVGYDALQLKTLASKLGVDTTHIKWHDALHDCIVTAAVYKKMVKELFV